MFENIKFKLNLGNNQSPANIGVAAHKNAPTPTITPAEGVLPLYSDLYRAFNGEMEKRVLFLETRGPKSLAQQPWVVEIVKSCADRHFSRVQWNRMLDIYKTKKDCAGVSYKIGSVDYGDPSIFGFKHTRFQSLLDDAERFKGRNRVQLEYSEEFRFFEQELDRFRERARKGNDAIDEDSIFSVPLDFDAPGQSLSAYLARATFCEVAPLLLKASLLLETLRELKITLHHTLMTSIVLDGREPWDMLKSGRLRREVRVRLENNSFSSRNEAPPSSAESGIVVPKAPKLSRDEMKESLLSHFSKRDQPVADQREVIKKLLSLVTRGNITFSELCNRLEQGEHYLAVIQSARGGRVDESSHEDSKEPVFTDMSEAELQLDGLPSPCTSYDGLLKHPISVEFFNKGGKYPALDWIDDLDNSLARQVEQRLARLRMGNFGDCKQIRPGLYEARIHSSSGLRVFFCKSDSDSILILNGCIKDEQDSGIAKAMEYRDSLV